MTKLEQAIWKIAEAYYDLILASGSFVGGNGELFLELPPFPLPTLKAQAMPKVKKGVISEIAIQYESGIVQTVRQGG